MLSTLPKLADRAFILGFFLPSLLFLLALSVVFIDIPWVERVLDIAGNTGSLEKLAVFIIAVWTLAVLMLLVNHAQYQLLEGIRWPISKFKRSKLSQKQALEALRSRRDELRLRQKTIKPFPRSEYQELQRILGNLARNFPRDTTLLLPTRFGNAIRSFEHYANDVYGADSVTLWTHLASVTPKQFHEALGDARSQVDCLVNICFFSAIVALTALARLMWEIGASIHITPFTVYSDKIFTSSNIYVIVVGIAAISVSIGAYRLSIERIYSWGRSVKAAFDCYLPALAKRLGYELPKTADDQRKFWIEVSQRVVYHSVLKPERWPQISPATNQAGSQPTTLSDDAETSTGDDESEGESDEVEIVNGDSNDG